MELQGKDKYILDSVKAYNKDTGEADHFIYMQSDVAVTIARLARRGLTSRDPSPLEATTLSRFLKELEKCGKEVPYESREG